MVAVHQFRGTEGPHRFLARDIEERKAQKAEEQWRQAVAGEKGRTPGETGGTPGQEKEIFDESDLYGPDGPQASDINQDTIGDCTFLATLSAFAQQKPEFIQNAITYDPNTQTFTVQLYAKLPFGIAVPVKVTVTQADIQDNLARDGGSAVDNHGDGALWPAVMEAANAKLNDSNWSDGLAEGYEDIGGGPFAKDTFVLTGDSGAALDGSGLNELFIPTIVDNAHAAGKPVTISITEDGSGLAGGHAYQVERASIVDGKLILTLRNPWGTDNPDSPDNLIMVSFDTIVENGQFGEFNIIA